MKGVAVIATAVLIIAQGSGGLAMELFDPPQQYSQLCEANKATGTGFAELGISLVDYELALDYSSSMAGDGDFEIDQVHAYSQRAEKLQRRVDLINDTQTSNLNLFSSIRLYYSGLIPLVGENNLASALGAQAGESFAVNKMERIQTAFATSTRSKLAKSEESNNLGHIMGIDTRNSFEGLWSADSSWYEMFSKDIATHQEFSGKFGVEKAIKFFENSTYEQVEPVCLGIDC